MRALDRQNKLEKQETKPHTWVLWKCLRPEKQAQFVQDVWDKFGIDLLLYDNPVAPVTYKPKLEDSNEIDKIMRKPPMSRRALGD